MAKIRHVAIFTFKEGVDRVGINRALDALRANVPGFTSCAYGFDAGLKSGNADLAVSYDFADEAAYKKWDTDAEHERIRREQILPYVSAVSRVQFRLD